MVVLNLPIHLLTTDLGGVFWRWQPLCSELQPLDFPEWPSCNDATVRVQANLWYKAGEYSTAHQQLWAGSTPAVTWCRCVYIVDIKWCIKTVWHWTVTFITSKIWCHWLPLCGNFSFLCFHQFSLELRNKVWPSFRQAGVCPHSLGCMDFVPINCHINFMQVSYPKSTTSAGRTFSIRFGRKNSLFGLDPDQGTEYRHTHAPIKSSCTLSIIRSHHKLSFTVFYPHRYEA